MEDNIFLFDHLVFLCVCPCYNMRTHPTLKKNIYIYIYIAACENQGKQHELSDHWKSIKTLILKTGDDAKKTPKRLTGIQVLIKYFTSYKIRCKSQGLSIR